MTFSSGLSKDFTDKVKLSLNTDAKLQFQFDLSFEQLSSEIMRVVQTINWQANYGGVN